MNVLQTPLLNERPQFFEYNFVTAVTDVTRSVAVNACIGAICLTAAKSPFEACEAMGFAGLGVGFGLFLSGLNSTWSPRTIAAINNCAVSAITGGFAASIGGLYADSYKGVILGQTFGGAAASLIFAGLYPSVQARMGEAQLTPEQVRDLEARLVGF